MSDTSHESRFDPRAESRARKFWRTVHTSDGDPDFYDESAEGNLRALFWGARIKATDVRIDILLLLSEENRLTNEHRLLSAADIAGKLDETHSMSTVYRALDVLVRAGFVDKVDLGHDRVYYERASDGKHHHHHAVCTSCGEIEDVAGCNADGLNEKASTGLKKFRHIQSHSLEFFGLCRKCEKKH
jgi:Fur family ferric uptake transcriptional regulator